MPNIEDVAFSRLLRLSNIWDVGNSGVQTSFINNLARMTETDKIIRVVCKSVSFENNAYNIYTSGPFKNNVFTWEILFDTTYSYTINEPGFYTAQQLIDILQPVIEASLQAITPGMTLTMEIGEFSKKIEYSTDSNLTVLHIDAVGSLNPFLGNNEYSPGILLGFPYTSDSLPNLAGLQNVYVNSTTMAEGNLVDGDVENHDILAEVPVTVPFGSRVNYESRDDELDSVNYESVRNFDSIKVTLVDINNTPIELNGGNVIVVLKIYYL